MKQHILAFALSALAQSSTGSLTLQRRESHDTVMLYASYGGGIGACGNPINDDDYAVTVSQAVYGQGEKCGTMIAVDVGGVGVTMTIQDYNPDSAVGTDEYAIIVPVDTYFQLAGEEDGETPVTWRTL